MTDYYQIAQKLAASLPEFNGNVPSTAWNVLINRLKGVIPGEHSRAWPQPSGPSFRKIFFPIIPKSTMKIRFLILQV